MEKQEMEMKQKLEKETGNGNWKQKWEQKTGLVLLFSCSVLSHYSSILLSNQYGTGLMRHACFATPVLCFVITAFSVIE